MSGKVRLVVPEAPPPGAAAAIAERALGRDGLRLGVLDNSKGNADHLLRFIVDDIRAAVPVKSVVSLRKSSVSLPAPPEMLERLAAESDFVVTAMAD